MSPIETERKLRQLDNDVQSIYELLSAISGTQARHGNRLQEHSEALDGLDTHLGSVETKVDALDTRLGSVETKVDALDTRLGSVETKVDGLDTRFGSVETKVDALGGQLDSVLDLLRGGSGPR